MEPIMIHLVRSINNKEELSNSSLKAKAIHTMTNNTISLIRIKVVPRNQVTLITKPKMGRSITLTMEMEETFSMSSSGNNKKCLRTNINSRLIKGSTAILRQMISLLIEDLVNNRLRVIKKINGSKSSIISLHSMNGTSHRTETL